MIVDVIFGFLGSGKTTFITRVLEQWGGDEKIVVLVNEFGDVGIDGGLLSDKGGNVVEMPSGCICCTLQADFRNQIFEIHRSFEPDRVLIEPSGVATIGTIDWILSAQTLEPLIQRIHKVLMVDASGFMDLYKANRRFVEAQVEGAHLVLLNKCDRVDKLKVNLTQSAVSSINPEVAVLTTRFAEVDWHEYRHALSDSFTPGNAASGKTGQDAAADALSGHGHGPAGVHPHPHAEDAATTGPTVHIPHFHETDAALGYESFGKVFDNLDFDPDKLARLFHALNDAGSGFGEIVRAKGIFSMGGRWTVVELASGEVSTQPVRSFEQSKVAIIGKNLDRSRIAEALENCAAA